MSESEVYEIISGLQVDLENLKDTCRSLESRIEDLEREKEEE